MNSELPFQWRLSGELLAYIVWRLFPKVQLIGGGTHSIGFYYDFIFHQPLTKESLELIEVELHRFIKEDHPIRYLSMMRENAQSLFEHHHLPIFAERAGEEESNIVELLQMDDFFTLCPHLPFASTLEVGYVKLLDCQEIFEEEDKITRLTGTSRTFAKELKTFIKSYDALKKRDHRILGPKLNLFSFSEGSFGVIWHPKGMMLRQLIQDIIDKKGEVIPFISTPIATQEKSLNSIEPFYFEGDEYYLRSSFLRQHLESIKHFSLDPEDLPWKFTEKGEIFLGLSESQEWGLFCCSSNWGDFTTICCKKNQVIPELISSLQFIEQIITIFGFEARWVLVVGRLKNQNINLQQEAIEWLREAFNTSRATLPFAPDFHEDEGETTRLELRICDALGREWTVSEVGILTASQKEIHSQIISRRVICSFERFVGLLLEKYEGVLPFWLAPEQIRVMSIGQANRKYAEEVSKKLVQNGWRVKLDLKEGKLGTRIHEAEIENIPFLLLIGEQERMKNKISVRRAGKPDHNQLVDLDVFLQTLLKGERESA